MKTKAIKSSEVRQSRCSSFLLAIRPKTLPASLSPVLLGTAAVPLQSINGLLALCALACALFLQIAVNLANDYFDARSSVDSAERLGPVRVTQSGLIPEAQVIFALSLCVVIAIFCGLILVAASDLKLLAVGILAVIATFAYSGGPYPLASHGLGELTVLIFFGWVAVMGSYYIQTQTLNWQIFALANAMGMILSAIMLINNIRDIASDSPAGKKTLAVYLGPVRSRQLFVILMALVPVFHCIAYFMDPQGKLSALLVPMAFTLPFAYKLCRQLWQSEGRTLNHLLARTAQLSMAYGGATSACLLIA